MEANSMLNIFKNLYNAKPIVSKRDSPSERLCAAILRDYWCYDEYGKLKPSYGKGFLDRELLISGNKYNVVSKSPVNDSFELIVKDDSGKKVFSTKILYGQYVTNPNHHILYIDDFCRYTPQRQGVGKEMAKYIRELAENMGFTIIGVHIVAQPNLYKDAMNQEQLKAFYDNYLNSKNVRLESMENGNCVSSID